MPKTTAIPIEIPAEVQNNQPQIAKEKILDEIYTFDEHYNVMNKKIKVGSFKMEYLKGNNFVILDSNDVQWKNETQK